MKRLARSLASMSPTARRLAVMEREIASLKVLMGTLAVAQQQNADISSLPDAEFKVFSQFGEDGIIQYLVRETAISEHEKFFVEFGVENYTEANTIFLMLKGNWRGLVIDGSPENIQSIRRRDLYWRHNLTAKSAFVDRDNIDELIASENLPETIGLLSIDIDGVDYWVWERISAVSPIIVVAEYNSVFGNRYPLTVPYDPRFQRNSAHSSNLYWGCSIGALEHLGRRKGYTLVGSNSAGNNAFFVRNDRLGRLRSVSAQDAWVDAQFRESRGPNGDLTFLKGPDRLAAIAHLPVVNVASGVQASLHDFVS